MVFGFFRSFSFFKGRDTTGLTDDDLDFPKWINAHRDWRRRLTNYIDGEGGEALDEHVVCVDNRCELGKWIHGNGGRFYGELPVFTRLKHQHADFHASAGDVIRLFKSRGRDEAAKALQNDFDLHSIKVVTSLESLQQTIRQ